MGRLAIVGLAAAIALTATVFGTAAFSDTSLGRDAQVEVVADETGLLALIDGHDGTGLVEERGDGALVIDLTRGGAAGANEAATFTLGATTAGSAPDDHAFRIVNQATRTVDVTVEYVLDSGGADDSTVSFTVDLFYDAGGDGSVETTYSITENSGGNTTTITNVDPGDVIYASITVDTTDLTNAADLSGQLGVSAD